MRCGPNPQADLIGCQLTVVGARVHDGVSGWADSLEGSESAANANRHGGGRASATGQTALARFRFSLDYLMIMIMAVT